MQLTISPALLAAKSHLVASSLFDEFVSCAGEKFSQLALSNKGGYVDKDTISYSLLSSSVVGESVALRVGVFFVEYRGGCNCDDDPSAENNYREIDVMIDVKSGNASVRVLD